MQHPDHTPNDATQGRNASWSQPMQAQQTAAHQQGQRNHSIKAFSQEAAGRDHFNANIKR
tara:strand:+ start:554 stop:733 length:180 start_codon:yes stop_codon:yes gene_type:complete